MLQEEGGGNATVLFSNRHVHITECSTVFAATILSDVPSSPVGAVQIVMFHNPAFHETGQRSFSVRLIQRNPKRLARVSKKALDGEPAMPILNEAFDDDHLQTHKEFVEKYAVDGKLCTYNPAIELVKSHFGVVEDSGLLLGITTKLVQQSLISKDMERVITEITANDDLLHLDPVLQKKKLSALLPEHMKNDVPYPHPRDSHDL